MVRLREWLRWLDEDPRQLPRGEAIKRLAVGLGIPLAIILITLWEALLRTLDR